MFHDMFVICLYQFCQTAVWGNRQIQIKKPFSFEILTLWDLFESGGAQGRGGGLTDPADGLLGLLGRSSVQSEGDCPKNARNPPPEASAIAIRGLRIFQVLTTHFTQAEGGRG
jgi:hypothetical protein